MNENVFWLLVAFSLACSAGFLYFGWRYRQAVRRNEQEKKDLLKTLVFAAAAFAFLLALTISFYSDSKAEGNGEFAVLSGAAAGQGAVLADYKLESFSRQVTPVECSGAKNVVYWRELRVYNVTRVDAEGKKSTAYYSTITLYIRNEGASSLIDLVVRERIPEVIAADPSEVINFSIAPLRVVKGSVVVDWIFEKIEPGQTVSTTYTVEKRVSGDVLENMGAPEVVGKMLPGEVVSPPPLETQMASTSSTYFQWIYVIPLFVILAVIALYFEHSYKKRFQAEE